MKTIYKFIGEEDSVFIPVNTDGTFGNPWVERNTTEAWEVVQRIMECGAADEVKVIRLIRSPEVGAIHFNAKRKPETRQAPNGV